MSGREHEREEAGDLDGAAREAGSGRRLRVSSSRTARGPPPPSGDWRCSRPRPPRPRPPPPGVRPDAAFGDRLRLDALAHYFLAHGADPQTAQRKAIVAVGCAVQNQAFVMGFSDTFFLLGVTLLVALAATLLLKRPASLAAGGH